jgi:2-keto-3-deoxy-L-fuconate dehydrogenase
VQVLDVVLENAKATCEEISSAGGKAAAHACDVTDQRQVKETFQQLDITAAPSILVNNAGISSIGPLEKISEDELDRVYRVNVKGFYNCMLAAVPGMKANNGGVIVNIASIAGSSALADRFAYSMSKGAVIAMTYSVARDYLSYNIRCNSISPARVHTPFVDDYLRRNYPGREQEMFEKLSKSQPIGRMGQPEEVAALALFLCSDEASFITGVDYLIDGGFTHLRG